MDVSFGLFANNFDPTFSDGRKLWDMVDCPATNPYDSSANESNEFFSDVIDCALLCLWIPLLTFSVTTWTGATATTMDYNLLENYTLIFLAIITAQMGIYRTLCEGPEVVQPMLADLMAPTPDEQATLVQYQTYKTAV